MLFRSVHVPCSPSASPAAAALRAPGMQQTAPQASIANAAVAMQLSADDASQESRHVRFNSQPQILSQSVGAPIHEPQGPCAMPARSAISPKQPKLDSVSAAAARAGLDPRAPRSAAALHTAKLQAVASDPYCFSTNNRALPAPVPVSVSAHAAAAAVEECTPPSSLDRKSTRLNSSHT